MMIRYHINTMSTEEFTMNPQQQKQYNRILAIVSSKEGHIVSGVYVNNRIEMRFECKNHHQWNIRPKSILAGHWCKMCSHGNDYTKNFKPDIQVLRNFVENKGLLLSTEYINNNTPMLWKCNNSKHDAFYMKWRDVHRGKWCKKCGTENATKKMRLDILIIQQVAIERGGRLLSTIYVNNRLPLTWCCSKGHIWNSSYETIRIGAWCKECNKSGGEAILEIILIDMIIPHQYNYRHPYLKQCPYDYLVYYNSKHFLIEFDGAQHFSQTRFHRTEEEFKTRQNVDRAKTLLALQLNIPLIRIDYTQIQRIKYHLVLALSKADKLYLSKPAKYSYILDDPQIQSHLTPPQLNIIS